MILSFSYSSTANAALSATTAEVINGTAPYLTFNNGATKATDTSELLGITLSDGVTNTTYSKTNNPSTQSNPLELPVAGQTIADIGMLVPTTVSSVNLSTLIGGSYNYWRDDDGDGQGVGGISASGTLSVAITDAGGNAVARNDTLDGCIAYYKVVLTSTPGNLTTQYGTPNVTPFYGDSATYYIKPKIVPAKACFAQPNLRYGKTTESTYWGPTSQWDPAKGFKVQNLGSPSSNFPTTGSNGLSFELTIAGATAQSVIDTMTATVQGNPATTVSLALSASSANVLKVTLQGPKDGTAAGQTGFTPTTFSLESGTTTLYNFTISKWFIARPGGINYYDTQTYCGTTLPSYRIPKRSEYTNSVYATTEGNGGNYTRTIGGGLFAEWGRTNSSYYTGSDWENNSYWASEPFSGIQYVASSDSGNVGYYTPYGTLRAACVRP